MRIELLTSIMVAAASLSPGLVPAMADGRDFFRVTGVAANDALNIREESDPRAHQVGEIPPDGTYVLPASDAPASRRG